MQNYSFTCAFVWLRNLVSRVKEKYSLWKFEKSAGRIFGYKEELTEGEREYHNDEFRDSYSDQTKNDYMCGG